MALFSEFGFHNNEIFVADNQILSTFEDIVKKSHQKEAPFGGKLFLSSVS